MFTLFVRKLDTMDVKTLLIILSTVLIPYSDAAAVPTRTGSKHYEVGTTFESVNPLGLLLNPIPISQLTGQYNNDLQWAQQNNRYPINTYVPPTCASTTCPAGSGCVMQQVQCFRAPCYPQPTCVGSTSLNNYNNNRYPYTNGWNNNGWGYQNNGGGGWNTQLTNTLSTWPYTHPLDNGGTASITVSNNNGQHLHCTPVQCNIRCPRGQRKNAKGCFICQCV